MAERAKFGWALEMCISRFQGNICLTDPWQFRKQIQMLLLQQTKLHTTLNPLHWWSAWPVGLSAVCTEGKPMCTDFGFRPTLRLLLKIFPSKTRPRVQGENACTRTTLPHRRVSGRFLKLSTNTRSFLYMVTEANTQWRAASLWVHVCSDVCLTRVTTVTTDNYTLLPKYTLFLNTYLLPPSLENTPTRRENHQGTEVQHDYIKRVCSLNTFLFLFHGLSWRDQCHHKVPYKGKKEVGGSEMRSRKQLRRAAGRW